MPSSAYFDNLGLNELKQFAQEWVNDFKNIKIIRIELRRFSTPRRLVKDGPQAKVLYAVVFWTLEDNDYDVKVNDILGTVELEVGEIGILPYFSSGGWRQRFLRYTTLDLEQRNHEQQVRGGIFTSTFNRLLAATKYMQTVPPTHYPKLFGNDFKNVYKTGAFPGYDYLKEWVFFPLAKGEDLPLSVQNSTPPVVLYTSHEKPGTVSAEAPLARNIKKPIDRDTLVIQHGAAAQLLYKSMVMGLKAKGKTITHSTPDERRAVAVEVFDAGPERFSPLKKKQINTIGPYDANTQHPRKMIGTIISLANISGLDLDHQAIYKHFKALMETK